MDVVPADPRPAPAGLLTAGPRAAAGVRPDGTVAIADVQWRERVSVQGRVRSVRVEPAPHSVLLDVEVWDDTGGLTAVFYGRHRIAGVEPGARVRLTGRVGEADGHLAIANPAYELLPPD